MKKILKLCTFIISFILFTELIKAGSLSVSAPNSVSVGSAVKVKVNINNLAGRFRVTSSDGSILSGGAEDFWESTQTIIFSAKKAGSATITVIPVDVADYDTGAAYSASRSVTITVGNSNTNNTVDINKTYSSNNNLASLSVEGYSFDKEFSADITEYSLSLDNSVKKVVIKAKAEDNNANIKGIGEVAVSEGTNTINVIVTAENGNEKTYVIKVDVEDKNPIEVKIGKKKYTVVKNADILTPPQNYIATTVKINDIEVPAFTSEITGYVLVGLKDSKGNISLYIYNPSNGKYQIYQEFSFSTIRIQLLKEKNIPIGYKKYQIEINDKKIDSYKKNKKANYALIYGMNVDTGDIGWYSYDTKEHTLQRYDDSDIKALSVLNNKYLITIIVLTVSILMLMLFTLILMLKIRNTKR